VFLAPVLRRRPIAADRLTAAVALIGLVVGVCGAVAYGKEASAGCAELNALLLRARNGQLAALGQLRRGSALGAYQVLRVIADSIVHDASAGRCGALGRTLNAALRRSAAASTASDAGAELEMGLDAAESLSVQGHLRYFAGPLKLIPASEAVVYGGDCPDLFSLVVRLDGPPVSLGERVKTVLADLKTRPRCEPVRRVLAEASPTQLAHAVDSVRLDEPDSVASSGPVGLSARCPELPLVAEQLAAAISVGAPRFNAGDALACQQTYQAAVRAITSDVVGSGRCPAVRAILGVGLARSLAAGSPVEGAWALRASFDAVLSGDASAAP
jgi:hypothetical protein